MSFKQELTAAYHEMLDIKVSLGYKQRNYMSHILPFIEFCADSYPDAMGGDQLYGRRERQGAARSLDCGTVYPSSEIISGPRGADAVHFRAGLQGWTGEPSNIPKSSRLQLCGIWPQV